MQSLSLSSHHGTNSLSKSNLASFSQSQSQSQKLHFKPNSPKKLNYNHTSNSIETHQTNLVSPLGSLTWRYGSKTVRFLGPVLCGISSNTLSASDGGTSISSNSIETRQMNLISPPGSLRWRYGSEKVRFLGPVLCGNSSNTLSASEGGGGRSWVEVVGEVISTAFPIWVALGCFLGLVRPSSFNWVQPKWTMMGITLTMLGMGMTLTFDDLKGALAMPKELLAGFFLQYSVMPLSAFLISKLLNLPSYYAAGLILVGCCPGGTASNIVTYIARGNVALSVLMTAASTVSAVVMTPFLTSNLAGQYVAVDAIGLLMSTLQVVLLPVLVGAFLNQYFKGVVKLVSPLMPPIAVATVAILCGNAIAQSSSAILNSGQQVVLAAVLLHLSGFFFGYFLSRILGVDVSSSRTISIEVGMQNSVLGVVLATQHFGNPLTAVPCAVSSVCHSILGSALAGIWRQIKPENQEPNV